VEVRCDVMIDADIDECEETPCTANSNCINTEGSFQCQCPPGFIASPDSSSCIDPPGRRRHTSFSCCIRFTSTLSLCSRLAVNLIIRSCVFSLYLHAPSNKLEIVPSKGLDHLEVWLLSKLIPQILFKRVGSAPGSCGCQ